MDTLIISGGNIGIDLALGLLKIKRFDHIIGVDGGLKPVFHSANVDGGDEFNRTLFEKYKDQIHYM